MRGEAIPPLAVPPALPKDHRVIVYPTSRDSLSVRREEPADAAVVMISGPACEWSQAALNAIASNPRLRRAILPRLIILGPPAGEIAAAYYRGWNRDHPRFRQAQAFSASDWPEIPDWDKLPTFYFLTRGEIRARVVGWGPETTAELAKDAQMRPP